MELAHLQRIGLLDYTCLPGTVLPRSTGWPAVIRDAQRGVPELFAVRQRRKESNASKATVCKLNDVFPSISEMTVASWVPDLMNRLKDVAVDTSDTPKEWTTYCKQLLTNFTLSVATQPNFQDAVAQSNTVAMERMVRIFLEKKLKGNRVYLERAAQCGGVVPLWKDTASRHDDAPASFDCLLVEPFNPDWDPTFTLESDGMKRIGAAVKHLAEWISVADASSTEGLLEELEEITKQQQVVLHELQEEVMESVQSMLRSILQERGLSLHSLVPFGSAELGTATAESDIDLTAFVHTSDSPQALLQHAATALQRDAPTWLCRGTLSTILQTSRIPTMSFEFCFCQPRMLPGAARLREILTQLGIQQHLQEQIRQIAVDISFNNDFAALEIRFYSSMLGTQSVATRLLIWLKYWTKSEGINNTQPGFGTLSSCGWRMMLLAVLMEQGIVPCFRDGFEAVDNPSRLHGVNVWWDQSCKLPETLPLEGLPLLQSFARELHSCVGSKNLRVFQLLTKRPEHLDSLVAQMSVKDSIRDSIQQAMHSLPDRIRLLVCDVDGVLFQISDEMRAKALEDAGEFFFNTAGSVPECVAPRLFDFVHAAMDCGYSVAIVSGKSETILPQVKLAIERQQRQGQLRPFLYLFKLPGSRALTVEHKSESLGQILRSCTEHGKTVDALGILDDMEPHMAAFLEGARHFGVPTFALNVYEGADRELHIRPHNPHEKHLVILALPHGSHKMMVLQEVCNRLQGARLVVFPASAELWDSFVGKILDLMNEPGVRYILIKIAPDMTKVKQLALFVQRSGLIYCFYQPLQECGSLGEDFDNDPSHWSTSARLQLLSQFCGVLHSNTERQRLGSSAICIATPAAMDLWPPGDESYRCWADNVWNPQPGGIVSAFQRLGAKALKCRKMLRERERVTCFRCVPVKCYHDAPVLAEQHARTLMDMCGGDGCAGVLSERAAAGRTGKKREAVRTAMQHLQQVSDVVRVADEMRRDSVVVALDIVEQLLLLSEKPSSMPYAAPLENELRGLVE